MNFVAHEIRAWQALLGRPGRPRMKDDEEDDHAEKKRMWREMGFGTIFVIMVQVLLL